MRPVTLSLRDGVAVVTLDDPRRRNVLSPELVAGIGAAFDEAEADERVRAVVIAAMPPAFCAGAELDTLLSAADGDFAPVRAVYDGFLRVLRSPLLTVAAVDGAAVGAGLNLALACDLRLAGPRARFDSRFAQLQLHPGGGHLYLLERAVGHQQAAAASLLSHVWDAREAARVGLVLDVVEGDVAEEAVRLVSGLDRLDRPLAERMVSSLRASGVASTHDEALALETEAQEWSTSLPGFVAGVTAVRQRLARG